MSVNKQASIFIAGNLLVLRREEENGCDWCVCGFVPFESVFVLFSIFPFLSFGYCAPFISNRYFPYNENSLVFSHCNFATITSSDSIWCRRPNKFFLPTETLLPRALFVMGVTHLLDMYHVFHSVRTRASRIRASAAAVILAHNRFLLWHIAIETRNSMPEKFNQINLLLLCVCLFVFNKWWRRRNSPSFHIKCLGLSCTRPSSVVHEKMIGRLQCEKKISP